MVYCKTTVRPGFSLTCRNDKKMTDKELAEEAQQEEIQNILWYAVFRRQRNVYSYKYN